MSTVYVTEPPVSLEHLMGNLPEGLRKHESSHRHYTVPEAVITDGKNFIWAYERSPEAVEFERFGGNKVYELLTKIAAAFNVKILDQYGLELDPRE